MNQASARGGPTASMELASLFLLAAGNFAIYSHTVLMLDWSRKASLSSSFYSSQNRHTTYLACYNTEDRSPHQVSSLFCPWFSNPALKRQFLPPLDCLPICSASLLLTLR